MISVFEYFQNQAKLGSWGSLYDSKNPSSYSFLLRLENALNLLKDLDGKVIMDLGCGTGVLIPYVVNNGGCYIGIDISDNMMLELKEHYCKFIENNRITLLLGDALNIDFPLDINIIIGLGFIEYFEDPHQIIKKIYFSLSKNGKLILSFPNSFSIYYFSLKLTAPFRWILRKITKKSTIQPKRKLWNAYRAKKLFRDVGFEDIEIVNYHINIIPYPFVKFFPNFANYIGSKMEEKRFMKINFFATSFIVIGKK